MSDTTILPGGSPIPAGDLVAVDNVTIAGTGSVFDPLHVLASGTEPVIENQGTPIAGAPHSTYNFTGGGVIASDAGSGVADITVPGVIIARNEAPLPGAPHTEINFTGHGVSATDEGGGVADVNIEPMTYVYRPGATGAFATGPNVFTNWEALMDATDATIHLGRRYVQMDNTFAPLSLNVPTQSVSTPTRPFGPCKIDAPLAPDIVDTIASLNVVAGTVTLVTAGAQFTIAMVGGTITIAGATTAANNNTFKILSFVNASTITYFNAAGVNQAGAGGTTTVVGRFWDLTDLVFIDRTDSPRANTSQVEVIQGARFKGFWLSQMDTCDLFYNGTGGPPPIAGSYNLGAPDASNPGGVPLGVALTNSGFYMRIQNTIPTAKPFFQVDIGTCFIASPFGNSMALGTRPVFPNGGGNGGLAGDQFAIVGTTVTLTDVTGPFVTAMVNWPITITGATSPGNNGTFIVTVAGGAGGSTLSYVNPTGVSEAFPGGGTWSFGAAGTTPPSFQLPQPYSSAPIIELTTAIGFNLFLTGVATIEDNVFKSASAGASITFHCEGDAAVVQSSVFSSQGAALLNNPQYAGSFLFKDYYLAQRWRPSAIVNSVLPVAGAGDQLTLGANKVMTLFDAAGAFVPGPTSVMIGRAVNITGSATAANNGQFQIAEVLSATTLTFTNLNLGAASEAVFAGNYTIAPLALMGEVQQVSTATQPVRINLPICKVQAPTTGTLPYAGCAITVLDIGGNAAANAITVRAAIGDKINNVTELGGGESNTLISTAFGSIRFWTDGLGNWFKI